MKTEKSLGKRILSLALSFLMVLSLVPMSAFSTFAEETSESGLPDVTVTIDTGASVTLKDTDGDSYYEIGNADELYAFDTCVRYNDSYANGELTNDIVVNEGVMSSSTENARVWTGIGPSFNRKYGGKFEGNFHTVSGLYFNQSSDYSRGLFAHVDSNAVIQNLGVINSYLCNKATVRGNIGSIVGEGSGTVINCYSNSVVKGVCANGIGGGNVINCYFTGSVNGYNTSFGISYDEVTNSYCLDTCGSTKCGTPKTAEQFESGEVAYLLQGDQTENVWGQKLGTDNYPVFGADRVYYGYTSCDEEIAVYTNDASVSTEKIDHNYVNGFCSVCDSMIPATYTTDKHDVTGDGEADAVYEIGNAGQLYWFADKVTNDNANFGSANAILTQDIIVNEGQMNYNTSGARVWKPIGNFDNQYNGVFDGNDNAISGLYYNDYNGKRIAVFGAVGTDGIVKNLGLENSLFLGSELVAGIAVYCYGKIDKCYNASKIDSGYHAGGIVVTLYAEGVITNCYNTGNIYSYQGYYGGIVGGHSGTVKNCYNIGDINIDQYTSSGYIFGGNTGGGTVENCYYLDKTNNAGSSTSSAAEAKSESQFVSGEVAYLLQGDQTENIWGQELGVDKYPVFSDDRVYYGYYSCSDEAELGYTNRADYDVKPDHSYDDGACVTCGKVCEHEWKSGACTICKKECEHEWYYGTCDICGISCGHSTASAEYNWEFYADDTAYASVTLTCASCSEYIDSYSEYLEVKEVVEAVDCQHPGGKTYTITYEYNGEIFTDTQAVTVKSDNHTGTLTDGFCSECNGYEPAKTNDNDTPDDEWDDYYEISNAGQLYWYAQQCNEKSSEVPAKLMKDINIPENAPNWEPINCSSAYFDGNFKTISGLKCIGGDAEYVGLFGMEGWWYEISNLHITDSYFEGESYVGAVVASMTNGGNVTNCYVTNTTVKGDSYTAGTLVGSLGISNVINCYVDTDNLVGYYNDSYGNVENSYYLADEDDGNGGKTAEQFESGEVAYLLQAGIVGEEIYDEELGEYVTLEPKHIWGQKIDTDDYPVLGGDKVYEVTNCDNSILYRNINENVEHNFINGMCENCDLCEEAVLNADGYYEISNAGQLYWFADKVNTEKESYGSANAILTNNIVVNEGEITADSTDARVWTPIGNKYSYYSGTFDGAGHTVSGLYLNDSNATYASLFYLVDTTGTVKNVGVTNSYFCGISCVAGIVGQNRGTVADCYNCADISTHDNGVVGGVVAFNEGGKIINSHNTGKVSNGQRIGGIAGQNFEGTITNCYNTGSISGDFMAGGIAGYSSEDEVTNCYNSGKVSATSDYPVEVGGISGAAYYSKINNCYNVGEVYTRSYYDSPHEGGIIGIIMESEVSNCYYLDTITAGGIDGVDVEGSAEAKTVEQFESGEVAYLLGDAFGQKLGEDDFPGLNEYTVYKVKNCKDENVYSNENEDIGHEFENGVCTVCKNNCVHGFDETTGLCPSCGLDIQAKAGDKYYTSIRDAVRRAAPTNNNVIVEVLKDIYLETAIAFLSSSSYSEYNYILDLGGHTLSSDAEVVTVFDGVDVTVTNGTITNSGSLVGGLFGVFGGKLTLGENLKVKACYPGVVNPDCTLVIDGADIGSHNCDSCSDYVLYVMGNMIYESGSINEKCCILNPDNIDLSKYSGEQFEILASNARLSAFTLPAGWEFFDTEGNVILDNDTVLNNDYVAKAVTEFATKVENVTITDATIDSFKVNFDKVPGAVNYWIVVNGETYNKTKDTSITITNREDNKSYEVMVLASFVDGTVTPRPYADVVTASTLKNNYDANFSADVNSIKLDWTSDAEKTWIFIGKDAQSLVAYDQTTENSYEIKNVKPNTDYYVQIKHVVNGELVDGSYVAKVRTQVDSELDVTASIENGELTASWNKIEGSYKYWVVVDIDGRKLMYDTTETTYTVSGINKPCEVSVIAACDLGNGAIKMVNYNETYVSVI